MLSVKMICSYQKFLNLHCLKEQKDQKLKHIQINFRGIFLFNICLIRVHDNLRQN
jgi:hypothetical protein